MPSFEIPYGRNHLTFTLPDERHADWISANDPAGATDPLGTVEDALDHAFGVRLEDYRGAKSAAIAVNDKTRPVPHQFLLPPLLQKLETMGIAPDNIHLIIATGTHTPTPQTEFKWTLPDEILNRYPVSAHNCDDATLLSPVGITNRGTPVSLNGQFMRADLKIALGNIEPHHFMGFSGGAKTAAIGLAGRETITKNHSMLPHPRAITGHYEDNPMRQDVEEIGEMIGLDFCLNAILNLEKQIVRVVAGSPKAVMQAGIPISRQICQVPASSDYDLVIASAGGYPKDINFYQAQKGLTHSAMLTKDGGTVILAAACPEGHGSQAYVTWMEGVNSTSQVFERFNQQGFQIGPHKAFQVARIASRVNIVLVSGLPRELVERFLLTPEDSLQNAIDHQLQRLSPLSKIAIMPYAVNTVPLR